jgi:uncharacterized protein (TIGR02266 family)
MAPHAETPARRELRTPLRTEVLVGEARLPRFLGYTSNVSEEGAFIQSLNPRPIGTLLKIRMHAPGESFTCEAEVIWVRRYAGRQAPCPGMGVRLLHVARALTERLRGFCSQRDVDPNPRRPQRDALPPNPKPL